jgi:tetratricopeptide (TPR) repeat protein
VGRSHGDLHGRNVLVGVQRGEAEYPAVFDYGEMGDGNVPVWDFVKLETEMKVRLLLGLYEDEEARSALFNLPADAPRMPGLGAGGPPGQAQGGEGRRLRAHRLAFAFRFENLLADLTERIHRVANPESPEPPGGRGVTGNARVDRALALFCRVRQEAALFLGDRQPQRGARGQWRDEYYFAAAVYGLCTAKFDYKEVEAAFALVSAGVAAARCEAARRAVREQIAAGLGTGSGRALRGAGAREAPRYPSYSVPLALAHALWTGRRCARDEVKALRVLEDAARDFGHAVPLLLEYGLALAETGRHQDALRMLEPLEDLGRAFHDEETLSRTGRLCKDLGDRALEDLPAAPDQLGSHPARAWYEAALRRYREAFEAGREYYPGINAATVALMLGRREEAEDLAASVLDICGRVDPGSAGGVEPRFWLLASQGEACVVLGREKQAAALYRQALRLVPARYRGLAQASYNQLCRLAWAAGRPALRAMEVFRNCPFRLKSGPLCNGGVRRRQWRRRKNC